jgi:hypothetical protein
MFKHFSILQLSAIISHQNLAVGSLVLVAVVLGSPEVVGMVERPALNQSQRQVLQTLGALGRVRLCLQILVVLLAVLLVGNLQIHLAHQLLPQALTVQ